MACILFIIRLNECFNLMSRILINEAYKHVNEGLGTCAKKNDTHRRKKCKKFKLIQMINVHLVFKQASFLFHQ